MVELRGWDRGKSKFGQVEALSHGVFSRLRLLGDEVQVIRDDKGYHSKSGAVGQR
jgi:hypothetical protein